MGDRGNTKVAATMAMPPRRLAPSDPSDEILVTAMTITKIGKITARISGAMIRAPPVAGATPRPPWKPMNGERLCPTIAASAARTWATISPPIATMSSTATAPLATSRRPETAAQRNPTARETFAPPVRPLPRVRGSGPPMRRGTMIPNGIPPTRKPAISAMAARKMSIVCIAGKYRAANRDRQSPSVAARLGLAVGGSQQFGQQPVGVATKRGPPLRVGRNAVHELGEQAVHGSGHGSHDPKARHCAVHPAHFGGLAGDGRDRRRARFDGPHVDSERWQLAGSRAAYDACQDPAAEQRRQGHAARQPGDGRSRQPDGLEAELLHHVERFAELAALDGEQARVAVDHVGVHVEDGARGIPN